MASIVKKLGPGRYRYRYVVDTLETIDPHASTLKEGDLLNNIIVVLNPPIQQQALSKQALQGDLLKMIHHLNIRNYSLGDDGIFALTQIIQHNRSWIESLDASHNRITDTGLYSIAAAVKHLGLKELRLNGNGFSMASLRSLCEAVSLSRTLLVLELSGNPLFNEGAMVLAAYLGYNCSIQSLHISGCSISNDGIIALGKGLEGNKNLLHLYLCSNHVSEEGIKSFSSSLEANASLLALHIANNPIGPMGTMWLGKMLNLNMTLTTLDISHCKIMRDGAVVGLYSILSSMLDKNKILRYVFLRNNQIDNTAIVWIAHCLSKCRTILEFDLEGNPLDQKWFLPDYFITNLGTLFSIYFLY